MYFRGTIRSIGSKWSSLWPGEGWTSCTSRRNDPTTWSDTNSWVRAPCGPSNLVLEQPMAESQRKWMTMNREEFGLWSFRQPVVSVQFANFLVGRVVKSTCVTLVRQQILVDFHRSRITFKHPRGNVSEHIGKVFALFWKTRHFGKYPDEQNMF